MIGTRNTRLAIYTNGVAAFFNISAKAARALVVWYQDRTKKLRPLNEELTSAEVIALLGVSRPDVEKARRKLKSK